MSYVERLESLRMKKQALENQLVAESRRPLPNNILVTKLKREKLYIKEEIDRLSQTA